MHSTRRSGSLSNLPLRLALAVAGLGALLLAPMRAQGPAFYPVDAVQPGMVAHGTTVFVGDTREPFTAHILGVLKNVIGPGRDLILARLEGGPLAQTGVIAGMSGSPVFIDGKLLGAVSYSLGTFQKEPIAGITPIREMIDAATPARAPLRARVEGGERLPLSPEGLVRAFAPPVSSAALTPAATGTAVDGYVPLLRPIATPLSVAGLSPDAVRYLQSAFPTAAVTPLTGARGAGAQAAAGSARFVGGDAIGVALVDGDFALSAVGTVTHVDGDRVYAFGHPLFNLGPVDMPMTRAWVHTVLPSLLSSTKLATTGATVGTLQQDRFTAIAGTLGPGPRTIPMTVALTSERGIARTFSFRVADDQQFTPLLSFLSVLSVMQAYEREVGGATYSVKGRIEIAGHGGFTLDDTFTGDNAAGFAGSYVVTPLALLARSDLGDAKVDRLDLSITASETPRSYAIERAWIDAARVRPGDRVTVSVGLREYRGGETIRRVPIEIPSHARGTVTLVVADATRVGQFDGRDVRLVGGARSIDQVVRIFDGLRRNHRLYVRLVSTDTGVAINGETLPGLPGSVLGVLEADRAGANALPLRVAPLGAWDTPLDRVVTGSRQVVIPLEAR